MVWLVVGRLVAASVLFGLGTLAVLKVPLGVLWKPAVAATAFGHILAALALLVALAGLLERSGQLATALAVAAALLLLSPLARGLVLAPSIPPAFSEAFAPAEGPALSLTGLLGPGLGEVEVTRHTYKEGLALDLYRGESEGPRPIVVVIHGGSWKSGDETQLPAINRHLAGQGYAVAAIQYRLAPAVRFPAMREDVEAATRWLQGQAEALGLDGTRVVLLGRSAGGQLALATGYTSSNPALRGVVALYPPTDMRWSWANPGDPLIIDTPGTLRAFLGGAPEEAGAVYDAASAIQHVGPKTPPTLLLHGGRDELVSPTHCRRLVERLEAAGVEHLLVELPWATHGLDANLGGPGGQLYVWSLERFLAHVTR